IAGGNGYSLALTGEGKVVGWGENSEGQTRFVRDGVFAISAGGTESVALTTNETLRIVKDLADQVVEGGVPLVLSVTTAGSTGPAYQWFFNGSEIGGATNASLALTPGLENAGRYRVSATDGSIVLSSREALIQVDEAFALELQFATGGPVALSVGARNGLPVPVSDFSRLTLQYSTNLVDWLVVTNHGSVLNDKLRIEDDTHDDPVRFYRLLAQP
ncbi:MAG TPA: hypothetical protein VHH73_14555, partial [Verrucomicrobiae bacterium]|nr:hypothetical protein [Verrucomicrobiae bacterium]